MNFLACLLMMILDTLLYCAIGLYFDKVCLWLCEYISSNLTIQVIGIEWKEFSLPACWKPASV